MPVLVAFISVEALIVDFITAGSKVVDKITHATIPGDFDEN